jgi:hypothetical protein
MPTGFYADHISPHLGTTPEGYLVCLGARLARSGFQTYRGSELGLSDDFVDCYRPPEEVLDKAFIASLNGKPVTDSHPSTFLNAQNASWFTKGHVQNPRVGSRLENGDQVIVGDLLITDPGLIERIRSGAVRELSCGYDFQLWESDDGYEQHKLRANHVAVVPTGRAGSTKIMDATYLPKNFAEIVQRFLGQHAIAVTREPNQRTCDAREEEPMSMTKKKLRLLRDLLDEMLEDEQARFAADTGIEPDSDAYARLARRYLGKELPRLGETRDEHETEKPRGRRAHDAADVAAQFEADCRRLRLELQSRG